MSKLIIRKVAVLGAGVMGSQIAMHHANAGITTVLFDLAATQGDVNSIVNTSIANLAKLKPAPSATPSYIRHLIPANYEQHLEQLRDCDLIIEAIGEKMAWKIELFKKISPYIHEQAIVASNTSGLSINQLAQSLPKNLRSRFLGIHFFNPPRYMKLVELTPSQETDVTLLPQIESYLVSTLGKGVVYSKDNPNFIANRIGVFSMLATMLHAEHYKIPLEVVDALTGPLIGRPKSATFRTADVVGLDTLQHVVNTMAEHLAEDPWHQYFALPDWLQQLIQQGALGQKTGVGVYKKQGNDIVVFDVASKQYRLADRKPSDDVLKILKIKNPEERMQALQSSELPEARFLWACFRDVFHYSAFHLVSIAETVRDVDLAIRWGFGWQQGPFEIWQAANWTKISAHIAEDIKANTAMSTQALPEWVKCTAVYKDAAAYAPAQQHYQKRSDMPVYQRQLYCDPMLTDHFNEGTTVFENDDLRVWHLQDDVAIASFKTKMNTITDRVLEGLQQAAAYAEQHCRGLVLWQRQGEHFSAGANLANAVEALTTGKDNQFIDMVARFQQTSLALRYAAVPVIAAVRGFVFGGGCELMMHCDRTVAAFESYIGLVETGVGLLPAGGGCKELALRAARQASFAEADPFAFLQPYFRAVAMAEVSSSAIDAQTRGILRAEDNIVFNANEILYVAIQQAVAMSEAGYRPPYHPKFKVCGKTGLATLKMLLLNYREGKFISEHDYTVASHLAAVMCGGDIETGCEVDEAWMLRLELDHFYELAKMKKTQERIQHTLTTGKPLRN